MLTDVSKHSSPPSGGSAVVNWPLRLAQQSFAGLLDRHRESADGLAVARRFQGARHALAALSSDERERFERWLALQVITMEGTRSVLAALGCIDAALAATVRVQLTRTETASANTRCTHAR